MDKRVFIVTGLPRFGSAWASCLLTCGDVYCAHELTGKCHDVDELAERILGLPGAVVGNSDSGALLILPELKKRIPDLRVVYVFRKFRESCESFACVSGLDYDHVRHSFSFLQARLERLANEIPGILVSAPAIFSKESAEFFWQAATGREDIPPAHLEKMLTLQVEQLPKLIQRAVSEPRPNMLTGPFNELLAAQT